MLASRRQFLQSSLGSSALLAAGLSVPEFLARSARAAEKTTGGASDDRVLVVLQLAGGNDGLNTVIPYADDAYAKNRIILRIGKEAVLKVDDHVGLHPRMTGLAKLLEEKRLSVLQGVGYPNPDRSHFRSMDIWQSAQPEVAKPENGWLGRCLECQPKQGGSDVPALHLGGNELPLALASREIAAPSVSSLDAFRLRGDKGAASLPALRELAAASRGEGASLLSFVQRSTLNAYASSQQIQAAIADERSPVQYPGTTLGGKLQNVAQLIDAGLKTRIYYLSLDGFDTHANQLETHANLLGEYSDAVAAFAADLAHRGQFDRVLLMSFSEFGRRVRENASYGTDHGAAAPMFLVGGKVQAGAIGKHPSLTDLDGEGDLKFHTDFRRVYATVLDQWLGCPSRNVLGQTYEPMPLFG